MAGKVTSVATPPKRKDSSQPNPVEKIINNHTGGSETTDHLYNDPDSTKSKIEYSKDKDGNTIGPNGKKIGRPKKKETKEQISFSISKDTKKKLMEYIAKNDELSVSSVCATAIKEYLKNHS